VDRAGELVPDNSYSEIAVSRASSVSTASHLPSGEHGRVLIRAARHRQLGHVPLAVVQNNDALLSDLRRAGNVGEHSGVGQGEVGAAQDPA